MPSSHARLLMTAAVLCLVSSGLLSCTGSAALPGGALAGNTPPDNAKDYSSLSGKLAKDMTDRGVVDALGAKPDKADLTTCTDHAGKQWQCRTWIFAGGKPKNNLRVVFYQADDSNWRVAAWDMF